MTEVEAIWSCELTTFELYKWVQQMDYGTLKFYKGNLWWSKQLES